MGQRLGGEQSDGERGLWWSGAGFAAAMLLESLRLGQGWKADKTKDGIKSQTIYFVESIENGCSSSQVAVNVTVTPILFQLLLIQQFVSIIQLN